MRNSIFGEKKKCRMVLDQVYKEAGQVPQCVSETKTAPLSALCVLEHCPDEGENHFPSAVPFFSLPFFHENFFVIVSVKRFLLQKPSSP